MRAAGDDAISQGHPTWHPRARHTPSPPGDHRGLPTYPLLPSSPRDSVRCPVWHSHSTPGLCCSEIGGAPSADSAAHRGWRLADVTADSACADSARATHWTDAPSCGPGRALGFCVAQRLTAAWGDGAFGGPKEGHSVHLISALCQAPGREAGRGLHPGLTGCWGPPCPPPSEPWCLP